MLTSSAAAKATAKAPPGKQSTFVVGRGRDTGAAGGGAGAVHAGAPSRLAEQLSTSSLSTSSLPPSQGKLGGPHSPGRQTSVASNLNPATANARLERGKPTKQQSRMHELGIGFDVAASAVPVKDSRRKGVGQLGRQDSILKLNDGQTVGQRGWNRLRGIAKIAGAIGAARAREEKASIKHRSRPAVDALMELGPLLRAKREREGKLRRTTKSRGGGHDGVAKPGSRGGSGSRRGMGSRGGSGGGSGGGRGGGGDEKTGGAEQQRHRGLSHVKERGAKGWGWSLLRKETVRKTIVSMFTEGRFREQSELEMLASRPRPPARSSVARLALDLNAEGNVLDRARMAKEVTRQASLQAQKLYQSLEVAAHRPAAAEVRREGGKGRGGDCVLETPWGRERNVRNMSRKKVFF